MEKSDNINELAAALSAFQGKQESINYNSKNPFLNNEYADLTALIEGCKKNLTANGLAVTQVLTENGVTTMLLHKSGQWIADTFRIEPTSSKGTNLAQQMGIAITYTRRYAYAAILGLVTDKDTDGADNTNPKGETPIQSHEKPKITNWLTEENFNKLMEMDTLKARPLYFKYNTPPCGMKKEYKEKLNEKFGFENG